MTTSERLYPLALSRNVEEWLDDTVKAEIFQNYSEAIEFALSLLMGNSPTKLYDFGLKLCRNLDRADLQHGIKSERSVEFEKEYGPVFGPSSLLFCEKALNKHRRKGMVINSMTKEPPTKPTLTKEDIETAKEILAAFEKAEPAVDRALFIHSVTHNKGADPRILTLKQMEKDYDARLAIARKLELEKWFISQVGTKEEVLSQFTKQPYDEE